MIFTIYITIFLVVLFVYYIHFCNFAVIVAKNLTYGQ